MKVEDIQKLLQENPSHNRNNILTTYAISHGMKVIHSTPMWEVEVYIKNYLKNNI